MQIPSDPPAMYTARYSWTNLRYSMLDVAERIAFVANLHLTTTCSLAGWLTYTGRPGRGAYTLASAS